MVKYCLNLKIKGEESAGIFQYCLDLNWQQENNAGTVFTSEIRAGMRRTLEVSSSSKISDVSLDKMVRVWKRDIEEGYRETSVTLDLASLISDQLESLEDYGNQQIPDILPPDLSAVEPQLGALPPLTFE